MIHDEDKITTVIMSDSSYLFPVDTTKECSVLPLQDEENTSLYIPVIPPKLQFTSSSLEEGKQMKFEPKYLKYYIENCLRLGKVRRIDFATREVPNFATPQVCAFIHFDCLFDNQNTRDMRENLLSQSKWSSRGFSNETEFCWLVTGPHYKTAHLLFKVNHKPIKFEEKDERNLEQVKAENLLLIEKLQEKEEEIRLLRQAQLDIVEKGQEQDLSPNEINTNAQMYSNYELNRLKNDVNMLKDIQTRFLNQTDMLNVASSY